MGITMKNDVPGSDGMFRNNFLAQAWLVLVLAICFGIPGRRSDPTQRGHRRQQDERNLGAGTPPCVGDDAAQDRRHPASGEDRPRHCFGGEGQRTAPYTRFSGVPRKSLSGWVVKARGQGYADTIEALIGMDPKAETITGLFILEQKETPGLGNKITLPDWRNQFVGKKTDTPLVVVKGDSKELNAIDAITGATISSRSVAWIVNQTVKDIKGRLDPEAVQLSIEERP